MKILCMYVNQFRDSFHNPLFVLRGCLVDRKQQGGTVRATEMHFRQEENRRHTILQHKSICQRYIKSVLKDLQACLLAQWSTYI